MSDTSIPQKTDESPPMAWKGSRLTKEAITSQGNKIRLVDSDPENSLDLYCYVRCTNADVSIVRSCRGVVLDGDKVFLQTYPYTPEFEIEEKDKVTSLLTTLDGLTFCDAHEGSLLRVFFAKNKWYISTHRKLDAFRSKWGGRQSFGELFRDSLEAEYKENGDFKSRIDGAEPTTDPIYTLNPGSAEAESLQHVLPRFLSTLDKSKCYCFIVRNTVENRIVCQPPERSTLYHVGTFSMEDPTYFTLPSDGTTDDNIGIPGPNTHTFSSWDEVFDNVGRINEDDLQGIIAFSGSNHIKILNPEYKRLFNIRGNEPSIKYRYLQVRMQKETTDELYRLYPRYTDTFEEYENQLYKIAKSIYDSYVQRFIKKKYVTLPREEYQVMRSCHSWHLEDRAKNRISLRKVIEKLNEQTPTNLNKMIRHSMQENSERPRRPPRRERSHSSNSNTTEPSEGVAQMNGEPSE